MIVLSVRVWESFSVLLRKIILERVVNVGLRFISVLKVCVGKCVRVIILREQGSVVERIVIFKFSGSSDYCYSVLVVCVMFNGINISEVMSDFIVIVVGLCFLLVCCLVRIQIVQYVLVLRVNSVLVKLICVMFCFSGRRYYSLRIVSVIQIKFSGWCELNSVIVSGLVNFRVIVMLSGMCCRDK